MRHGAIFRSRTGDLIEIDASTGRAVERPPDLPKTGEMAKARRNRRRIEAMVERRRLRTDLADY